MKLRRVQVAHEPDKAEPLWSPTQAEGDVETTDTVRQGLAARSLEVSADLLATIEQITHAPLRSAETHAGAALRKELELRAVFATVDVATSFTLGRRLDRDDDGDPLVRDLRRLLPERRARLRAFLADSRRREALRR